MAFDEQGWVARYVARGGNESDGKATAAKMREALNSASRHQSPRSRPSPQASSADLFGNKLPAPSAPRRNIKSTSRTRHDSAATVTGDAPVMRSQQELDLFHLSMEIEEKNAKETGNVGFLATAMIYASLPHSKVDGPVFKRRNGVHTISIVNDPEIGLPYGKIPRIITAFLCSEAKRYAQSRGRKIELGHSFAEFLAKLGLHNKGGVRGDIQRVRDQAERLFTSSITLIGQPGSQFHWENVSITTRGKFLWNQKNSEERSPWQSTLQLTEDFFEECIRHSVPIDLRTLHELQSSLAIDIYIWLTYRFNSIVVPTPIGWKQLQWQFGSNYSNTSQGEYNFKLNFKKQLRHVLTIYPEAKVDAQRDVLMLLPSPPHVAPTKKDSA
jgi:hypothetical protein